MDLLLVSRFELQSIDVMCKLSVGMFFAFGRVRLSRHRQHEIRIIMKVLLTTDGSQSAEQAIRWFSRFPLEHSASYEVMTVAHFHVYGVTPAAVFDETIRLESKHADESFQRASAILKEVGISGVHVARVGNAADEITNYAQEQNVDLIVVGAQGRGLLERMLIGSNSETVAQNATCSVLVVRPQADQTEQDQTEQVGEPLSLILASDGSETDRLLASQINALHLSSQTKIQLISVVEHPYLLEPGYEYDPQITQEATTALNRLADELSPSANHIDKHVLEKPHVADAILDYLGDQKADVLVLGDKGRSAVSRFFVGSVSRGLLRHAPCSVLLIRKR
jgi:nucleotide-binding universal stress UspA family protein